VTSQRELWCDELRDFLGLAHVVQSSRAASLVSSRTMRNSETSSKDSLATEPRDGCARDGGECDGGGGGGDGGGARDGGGGDGAMHTLTLSPPRL
jgi:hypothetical protein